MSMSPWTGAQENSRVTAVRNAEQLHRSLVRLKTCRAEDADRCFYALVCRRIRLAELIFDAEPLPLVPAHLMERQDLGFLDDAQRRPETGKRIHLLGNVGEAWNKNIAQPHRPLQIRKAARELEHVLIQHAGYAHVLVGRECLHVEDYQVDFPK